MKVTAAINANAILLSGGAGAGAGVLTRKIGLRCGSAVRDGMCAVAVTEPARKAASATTIRVPPPTVYAFRVAFARNLQALSDTKV